jgi:hypothetical protein
MATDRATESETDLLTEHPRVDVVANMLRMSVDVLLGHLRNQGVYMNPGDRVPLAVVFDALDAELAAGRPWDVERIEWHRH